MGHIPLPKEEARVWSTNIVNVPKPVTFCPLYILASTGIVAGNRHDAFNLKVNLQTAFKKMKRLGLPIVGAYFNADSAFDTKEARKVCFNHGLIPNIDQNKRNQKRIKRGRKRLFNRQSTSNAFPANGLSLGLISFVLYDCETTSRI